ncbi:MAG: sugar transferase [Phycisphaerales bacterium]|nr:sugar transferase [Phycisphaerales bacterium]
MALVTGESDQRASTAPAPRGSPRLLVVMHHAAGDAEGPTCCGITRRQYVRGEWLAVGAEVVDHAWSGGDDRAGQPVPIVLLQRDDMTFRIDDQLLRRLKHRDCDAAVLYGTPAPRYREVLEFDERGDIAAVRRTYVSGTRDHDQSSAGNDALPISDVVAVAAMSDAADAVVDAIGDLADAPRNLRDAGLRIVEQIVQTSSVAASTSAQLRLRLLALLDRDPVAFGRVAEQAGLLPTAFGWVHPSARCHPTARFVGDVILGENVCVDAGSVVIGPMLLDEGEVVPEGAVRREADDVGDSDSADMQLEERALDDTQPRQHVRDSDWWFNHGYPFLKRGMDYAGACVMLALLAVLMPAVWLANRACGDRGPIFYTHLRQTRGGKPFPCLKFRSMVVDADELKDKLTVSNELDGPQFKIAEDPRITPVGRFLRKTNLDELPQAMNILRGHMSIVGPRPSPHDENQLCPAWRHARLSVRPGITGLWQVYRSKARGDDDFQEWIHYDMEYVRRRGFRLDVKLLVLTILVCSGLWMPKEEPGWRTED